MQDKVLVSIIYSYILKEYRISLLHRLGGGTVLFYHVEVLCEYQNNLNITSISFEGLKRQNNAIYFILFLVSYFNVYFSTETITKETTSL